MHDTSLGTCQHDNQGQPIPSIGGSCNLASMHLDSSVIETPEPLMHDVQASGLDWEFYDLNPHASAGAQPASQNDFYGNMYSLASFFSDESQNPVLPPNPDYVIKEKIVEKSSGCGCNGSSKSTQVDAKKMYMCLALFLGLLLILKNK
jgi:hypothetical protein